MKRFLLIAYNFPPYWSTGTVRMAKLSKYLPEFDWEPLVLTAEQKHFGPELRIGMGEFAHVSVVRTPLNILDTWSGVKEFLRRVLRSKKRPAPAASSAPATVSSTVPGFQQIYRPGWRKRLERWIYPIDIHILWAPWAFVYGFYLLSKHSEISVILVSGPPHTQQVVGALLAKCFKRCKLVVDFRDTWIEDMNRRYPTPPHRWLEKAAERFVVETASKVTLVADDFVPLFIAKYGHPEKFVLLHNGYDPKDFEALPAAVPRRDALVINYMGGIGEGRNISGLLRAVRQLADEGKISTEDFQLNFFGAVYPFFKDESQRLGLKGLVHFRERVPYADSLQKMAEASLLLLVFENDPNGGFYTTKFFEYLQSRRPILVIGPARGAGKFIEAQGIGRCVLEDDVAGLAAALETFVRKNRENGLGAHQANIQHFSRRDIARRMAALLDEVETGG